MAYYSLHIPCALPNSSLTHLCLLAISPGLCSLCLESLSELSFCVCKPISLFKCSLCHHHPSLISSYMRSHSLLWLLPLPTGYESCCGHTLGRLPRDVPNSFNFSLQLGQPQSWMVLFFFRLGRVQDASRQRFQRARKYCFLPLSCQGWLPSPTNSPSPPPPHGRQTLILGQPPFCWGLMAVGKCSAIRYLFW